MNSVAGVSAPSATTLYPACSSAIDRMRLPTMCVSEPITPVTTTGVFAVSTPSERAIAGADAPCGIG